MNTATVTMDTQPIEKRWQQLLTLPGISTRLDRDEDEDDDRLRVGVQLSS